MANKLYDELSKICSAKQGFIYWFISIYFWERLSYFPKRFWGQGWIYEYGFINILIMRKIIQHKFAKQKSNMIFREKAEDKFFINFLFFFISQFYWGRKKDWKKYEMIIRNTKENESVCVGTDYLKILQLEYLTKILFWSVIQLYISKKPRVILFLWEE